MESEDRVRSAYKDEDKFLAKEFFRRQLAAWGKIQDVLDEYSLDITADPRTGSVVLTDA